MAKSSVKFKDSVSEFNRLSKEIANSKFANIYLLMGDESYFIDALCDQLASSLLNEAERSFNQIVLYGKDSEVGQVINYCRQMPMMGSREVVILKEAQQLRSIEKLSLYTSKPNASTTFVICHKDKNVDKRSQLYKTALANGVVFESVRPRDYEIGAWLTEFIRAKGFTIEPKALAMLTDNLGADIQKISNELTKLTLSLPAETKHITDSHIEQNIGISKEFNNYELCRAVLDRNFSRALMIADHFARNPKDNPLLVTIMTLFGQFKQLFIVNYLRWLSKNRGVAFPSDSELMGKLNIRNPYAINEIKQTSLKWNNKKVFYILGLMREYDGKSKGIDTGGASDGELLRELLLKIFTA